MERAQAAYVALVRELMERYAWVTDRVHRRKMAREAARGVLPNSTETKIVADRQCPRLADDPGATSG